MKSGASLLILLILMAVLIGALLSGQYSPANLSAADAALKQADAAHAAQVARDQVVVPAKAQADAKSILARTEQQIKEDAYQQELKHAGEMAALSISNTLRLNEVNATYQAKIADISAKSQKELADAQAAIKERDAAATVATNFSTAASIALLIVATGGSLALLVLLRNRARIQKVADDGINQTFIIDGHIVHKTSQQLGQSVTYETPTLFERSVALLTASALSLQQKSLEPLVQLRQLNSAAIQSTAQATNADLLKLTNAAIAGHIASAAILAQPTAAQAVARSAAQQASAVLAPADDLPELILLDDPAQRSHIEHVLEMSK